jgi:hypothetical protein
MALALVSMASLAVALLLIAAPAGAVVTTVGAHEYGIEPQIAAGSGSEYAKPLSDGGGPVVHSNAPYAIYWDPGDGYAAWEGLTAGYLEKIGLASGSRGDVYAVATQYRESPATTPTPASSNYNSAFRGAYTDVDHYPSPNTEPCTEAQPCNLTDAQIRTELSKYILANNLPTGLNSTTTPTPIYFIFTPPHVNLCIEGTTENCSTAASIDPLCSYHSFTSVGGATVLYAVLPWTAVTKCQDGSGLEEPNKSPADVVVNEIADEQIATVSDPLFTGWHDTMVETGNTDEVPDKCRNSFLPLIGETAGEEFNQSIEGGNYYLNDEFDQAALYDPYPGNPCINDVTIAPEFTAPNPVKAGVPVTFNASESYVDLGITKYHWEFGDGETAEVNCEGRTPTYRRIPAECTTSSGTGNPNSVASIVHKYTYGGTYNVTLRVTDDGGNEEIVTHPITVEGPAKPEEKGSETGSGSGSTTGGGSGTTPGTTSPAASTTGSTTGTSTTTSGTGSSPAKPIPGPVASAAVISRSLATALKKGLVIGYSVNEQVAGQFQVLLASSLAKRIGLHGPAATGLAPGSVPSIVIGKAILVTTMGGRNTVKISFGKKTAAKLRKLGTVPLTIRLIVRNAASRNPQTTTVISAVTLSH